MLFRPGGMKWGSGNRFAGGGARVTPMWGSGRGILSGLDAERIIGEIELLERMFRQPDLRPLNEREILAANRRHDEKLARSPWFRLWKSYGICCRPEPPGLRLPDGD